MPWLLRLRNVFRANRLDEELESELDYHLAETVDHLVAGGMPEDEAFRLARRRLGNYALQKERTRDMNVSAWLDATRADVVYGLRQLKLNPGFTTIAVLSLALGIGANTAIFQLVNAIRLKTLPVQNPRELVSIDFEKGAFRAGWWPAPGASMTYPEWEQIRTQQQAFSGMLAWSASRFNLTTGGEPRFAEGLLVSGEFFRELGVTPLIGRVLLQSDDAQSSCNAAAVISHAFWQREFGGDLGVLGRTVSLDGHAIPIIGVTQASFFGLVVGNRYDVAVPLCVDRQLSEDNIGKAPSRTAWWISAMGRLKSGWTAERATAHLRALSPAIMRATVPSGYNPDLVKRYLANKLLAVESGTGVSGLRQQYETPLWLLMATTGLVLLIACANLANLLLARAAVREPEIAVRLAIGASRWRIVRQLLAESLLLAVAGATLGAGLAIVLTDSLVAFMSTSNDPVFVDVTSDWRVIGFTAALALLTCLLFGLLPAMRATLLSPSSAMRAGGRSMTAGRDRFSLRRALVATQVALSLVLLFGALLFVRSLHNLLTVDPGFHAEGLLAVHVDFSKAPYPSQRRMAVFQELLSRLSAVPGVLSAAQVDRTPVTGGNWDNLVAADGASAATSGKQSYFNRSSPGYFRTMETPLMAGRDFDERDTVAAPKVAIVNEVFVRQIFGGTNPIGRTFHMAADAGTPEPLFQVVGLVANTKYRELREDFKPIAVFPIGQIDNPGTHTAFVLRVMGPPGRVMKSAKAAIGAMSPSIAVELRPFSSRLKESLLREQLMATLSGGFGLLAGLLATLGLYGVIAYMVERRRKEIGVRAALGANRKQVIGLVLREAILLIGLGLTAGIVLALFAGRAAAALLFGLQPHDVVSLAGASGVLAVIALLASYVPARRAAALDPIATLRNE